MHNQNIWYNCSECNQNHCKYLTCNISLNNFLYESTPNKSAAVETLLYKSNRLLYKPRVELNMHKTKNQLESTFIEIIKILK